MPTLRISRQARNAVVTRLADPSTGFTPRLTAAFADAGITAPIGVQLPIDFSADSQNFFQANIRPEFMAESTAVTLPYMTVYSIRSENTNLEKFSTFAGPLYLAINSFWSWKTSAAANDMETMADCYEEALFGTFNDPAIADWAISANLTNYGLVYNGGLALRRLPLTMSEENWMQEFEAVLELQAHAI